MASGSNLPSAVADYMLNFLSGQGAYPVGKVCAYTLNIKVSKEDQEKAGH